MPTNLIVIGGGQFGREVATWAGQAISAGLPWVFGGFLDDDPRALAGFDYPPGVLAPVAGYQPRPEDLFLCAIGTPRTKKDVCERLAARGARFGTLVHPTALVGRHVRIGDGTIIGPLAQLSCDLVLGRLVSFGTHSNIAHDTEVGDYSQISGSCEINGCATLGEGVFLGSHATILPGARVGDYAYVGAGSVVLRRVQAGTKVFGVPAVPIGPAEGPA